MKKKSEQKDVFENFKKLQLTVIAQRKLFLRHFTYEQLIDYTSHQDVKNWLLDIYHKKTRSIAPEAGGMKTNSRAVWTKNHVPLAIIAILNRKKIVSNEAIKDELDKLPDSIDPSDSTDPKTRKMYTENGIKTALAKFNKDAEKWLIDNKQLEDI